MSSQITWETMSRASVLVACLSSSAAPSAHSVALVLAQRTVGQTQNEVGREAEKSAVPPKDPDPRTADDRGGWVMAAYLGSAHTLASPVTISQPTLMNSLTFERVRF